jgi:hypothetical protein
MILIEEDEDRVGGGRGGGVVREVGGEEIEGKVGVENEKVGEKVERGLLMLSVEAVNFLNSERHRANEMIIQWVNLLYLRGITIRILPVAIWRQSHQRQLFPTQAPLL